MPRWFTRLPTVNHHDPFTSLTESWHNSYSCTGKRSLSMLFPFEWEPVWKNGQMDRYITGKNPHCCPLGQPHNKAVRCRKQRTRCDVAAPAAVSSLRSLTAASRPQRATPMTGRRQSQRRRVLDRLLGRRSNVPRQAFVEPRTWALPQLNKQTNDRYWPARGNVGSIVFSIIIISYL